jgi:hypothetical protein
VVRDLVVGEAYVRSAGLTFSWHANASTRPIKHVRVVGHAKALLGAHVGLRNRWQRLGSLKSGPSSALAKGFSGGGPTYLGHRPPP